MCQNYQRGWTTPWDMPAPYFHTCWSLIYQCDDRVFGMCPYTYSWWTQSCTSSDDPWLIGLHASQVVQECRISSINSIIILHVFVQTVHQVAMAQEKSMNCLASSKSALFQACFVGGRSGNFSKPTLRQPCGSKNARQLLEITMIPNNVRDNHDQGVDQC